MYDGDGTCVLVFMTKSKNHQLFVKEIYKDYFWVGFQENYVVFINLKKGQQSREPRYSFRLIFSPKFHAPSLHYDLLKETRIRYEQGIRILRTFHQACRTCTRPTSATRCNETKCTYDHAARCALLARRSSYASADDRSLMIE